MTDVITILDLPRTSKGFTALKEAAALQSIVDGSASPPRKKARLEGDSDSASKSRSGNHEKDQTGVPVNLKILGEPGEQIEWFSIKIGPLYPLYSQTVT